MLGLFPWVHLSVDVGLTKTSRMKLGSQKFGQHRALRPLSYLFLWGVTSMRDWLERSRLLSPCSVIVCSHHATGQLAFHKYCCLYLTRKTMDTSCMYVYYPIYVLPDAFCFFHRSSVSCAPFSWSAIVGVIHRRSEAKPQRRGFKLSCPDAGELELIEERSKQTDDQMLGECWLGCWTALDHLTAIC